MPNLLAVGAPKRILTLPPAKVVGRKLIQIRESFPKSARGLAHSRTLRDAGAAQEVAIAS